MNGIRLLADSTCDLSPELIEQYHITILPLNIVLKDKSYLDGLEITPDEIYVWADANRTTPKTAAPEMGAVMDLLKPMAEAHEPAIFFTISGEMSVTGNVIAMAASDLNYTELRIIDSRNLSTGIGLQILYAADLIAQGLDLDTVVAKVKARQDLVRASFVVDTLTYLQRGGRCSAVVALMGNAMQLKPKIIVKDGKMGVASKYRGKQRKVIMHYVQDLEEQLKQADPHRVFITHSGVDDLLIEDIRTYLHQLHHFDTILVTRAGGVISSHCGPATLGVLFYAQ